MQILFVLNSCCLHCVLHAPNMLGTRMSEGSFLQEYFDCNDHITSLQLPVINLYLLCLPRDSDMYKYVYRYACEAGKRRAPLCPIPKTVKSY